MSILLEALKQKNQRAKASHVSEAVADLKSTAFVDAEQAQHIQSIDSVDQVEESMQALVSKLSIEPPEGLNWQLKPDALTQPFSLRDDQIEMRSKPSSEIEFPASLALDLVLPKDTKSSVEVDENYLATPSVGLELKISEIPSLAIEPIPTIEAELLSEPAILNDVQKHISVAVDTNLKITDEHLDEAVTELSEQATQAQNKANAAVATESEQNQPILGDFQLPIIDKSPLSAKHFLSFSRRNHPPSESKPASDLATGQPKKHRAASNKVRKPILLAGGIVIGLGVVGYVSLITWESQQATHMQQMAHYKNLALSELPDKAKSSENTHTELIDAQAPVASVVGTDEPKSSAQNAVTPSAMSAVKDTLAVEKNMQPSPAIVENKSTSSSSVKGVLDTNRLSHELRSPKHAKPNSEELAHLNLQQTQPTAELLLAAYNAWQTGQLAQSEQLYRQILEKQPQQRDAMLGMLAVSQVNGSDQSVVEGYAQQLRRLYPQDKEVRFATGRVLGELSSSPATETELKLAQRSSDNAAEASYRLGLFYVEQQRWAEAQAAFFEAVNRSPLQADYRLNLAISYDQLGKQRLALEHYQAALAQAGSVLAKSDQNMILERVAYLQSQRLSDD